MVGPVHDAPVALDGAGESSLDLVEAAVAGSKMKNRVTHSALNYPPAETRF